MTVAEVQQRTSELEARIRALVGGGAGGVVGGVGAGGVVAAGSGDVPVTGTAFTDALTAASAPAAASPAAPAAGTDLGARAVALAKEQLGTPYKWGGNAPGGFDCSGLVQWTYKQLGIDLPRVSTQQGRAGTAVRPADALPGDLVFFERGAVDHIGIYAGNGQWVVAPKTGDVVKMQAVDLSKATAIRRVVPAPAATAAPVASASLAGLPAAGQRYAGLITEAARAAGIDPALLASVAWSESGFSASARSPAGALGLMQLMPRTAAGLGVDPLDPASALRGGATYLAQQLKAFGGRTDLALAAYNAGPSAVRKHSGIPPYPETQKYVTTVLSHYRSLGGTA